MVNTSDEIVFKSLVYFSKRIYSTLGPGILGSPFPRLKRIDQLIKDCYKG